MDELVIFLPAGTLPQIAADFRLSYEQAGLLVAALGAGSIAGNLLTLAADYVSRRALAAGSGAAVALALLAFGLSPWFAGLVLASLAWGVAADGLVSGAEVALVDVSGRHLTAALGRQNLLATAGDLLSPLVLVAASVLRVGWRALFLGAAVAMGGYSAWLAGQPLPRPKPDPEVSPVQGLLQVLRDRRVWLLAIAEAVLTIVDEPYLAFVIVFLERARGLTLAVAALVAMADLAGSALGSALAPRLLRRHGGRAVVLCGMGLPLAVLVLVTVPSLQFIAAAAGGACSAVIWVRVQGVALGLRPGQPGATSAVISWIALPALVFPVLVGAVADRVGLPPAMLLYVGATLLLALVLVPISRLRAPVEAG